MTALEVADWRRRVFAVYAAVRTATDLPAAHDFWRRERDDLFANHPSSPLLPEDRAEFTGLPTKPYDPEWRFEAELTPSTNHPRPSQPTPSQPSATQQNPGQPAIQPQPLRLEVETGTDGIVPFELLGAVDIPGVGSLDVWRLASYGGGLFIPVRDALAGARGGTYGGGRYLLDTVKGADLGSGATPTSLVLDFNFAYNPSCAYDPAWACPLAPPGNVVSVEIPAGERYSGVH
jgi:uncharacterized protein (DUF1684 family)